MEQYYARICWNSKGWRFPSGDIGGLKEKSNSGRDGFGHEEWLFNISKFQGYHYAFLQPVSNSYRKMSGKTIDVLLWTINPAKLRVQVGEIKNCQVLTDGQKKEAFEHYKKAGWLKLMGDDVARVNGKKDEWSYGMFNIRFRPTDAIQYDEPFPVAKPTDRIATLKMYKLVPGNRSDVDTQWIVRTRQGSTTIPTPRAYTRSVSQGGTVDPYHPVLQAELMKLLQEQFGNDNVVRESGWVDITVSTGKKRMLIEIKTYPVAKRAIREALGQILEYAYFHSDPQSPTQTVDAELFIVAPGSADEKASAYLNLLRDKFHIPVQYCQFESSGALPDAFTTTKQKVLPKGVYRDKNGILTLTWDAIVDNQDNHAFPVIHKKRKQ